MSVSIRLHHRPVNRMMLGAGLLGWLAWWLWPSSDSAWQIDSVAWMACTAALTMLGRGLAGLLHSYRLRRNLAASEQITDDHGSAREASWSEVRTAGMDDPEHGNFLGLYDGRAPVFAPPGTPFSLVEMPPGVGKTVNYVIGSILHRAELGASIVIPDPKLELGVMLGPQLKARGYEVWFANPTNGYGDRCGDVELNPYQNVLDAAYATDERRQDAPKYAADHAELAYPTTQEEKNPYFSFGSRRCMALVELILAVTDPGHCTPTDVFRMLADPRRLMKALYHARDKLEGTRRDDSLIDFVKSEAANLIHRAETNEENLGRFSRARPSACCPSTRRGASPATAAARCIQSPSCASARSSSSS